MTVLLTIFLRMLSKNLENSPSYDIFYKFCKKARVYYTLSISRDYSCLKTPDYYIIFFSSPHLTISYMYHLFGHDQ